MSVTLDKDHPRKNIADIFFASTNNVIPLRKYPIYPKKLTKPPYEGSEATNTNNSHGYEETENTKVKE